MAASAPEDVVLEEREEVLAAVFEDAQQLEEELLADLSDHTESERLLSGELDDVLSEDPTQEKDVSTSQFGFKYMCIVLAVALRLLAYFYLKDLFESSPQLVTPWNSFKRFKEGVFLFESESVDDVYDGDMFHVMPMFIHVLRPTLDSMFWLRVEWAILDLFCAYFMEEFVRFYVVNHEDSLTIPKAETVVKAMRLGNIAFAGLQMVEFSISQKVWTVIWFGKHGSPKKVQVEYRKKFGRNATAPDKRSIKRWWQKIFETGSVNKNKKTMPRYLLNPMTIGCWTVLSLSSIVNTLVAAFLLFVIKDHNMLSVFSLALASQLNPYYAILLTAVAVRFSNRLWAVFSTSVFSFTLLYGVNFAMVKDPWLLFSSTIGFFLRVPDLTPNVGIFWYFFIQIFEHYRLLFLFVFQLNVLIYLIPLAATLRKNPYLLGVSLLIFVAIFSSYPSYAETALYLPFIAAFFELHKFIRYGLVLGSTLAASLILTPIMWRMWVDTGTGNANFFFAIGWVFSVAQIFIFADLVSAYLRLNLVRNCCEPGTKITDQKVAEIEDKIHSIKLISVSPF